MVIGIMSVRSSIIKSIRSTLDGFPIVTIVGARQVGKTTLARQIAATIDGPHHWFDLEDPAHAGRLGDPMTALSSLTGLVVIDEVQRAPSVFPVLRVLVDRPANAARFLLLGSAAPELRRQSGESLAGRVATHVLHGFGLDEVGIEALDTLWHRGGFPRSLLAHSDEASAQWRREFVRTYVERDVPQLGVRVPAATIRRFWTMLAHYHGQTWNASEIAASFGVSQATVRRYLDLLVGTYLVRQLAPWHENVSKRQVKAPKVYLEDTGLLHTLLGLDTLEAVLSHPKCGASWEGLAIGQIARRLGAEAEECYFWGTHGGAELDLLVVRGSERRGFEIKRTSTPMRTKSIDIALHDLKLDAVDVVYPGAETFPLGPRVRAVAMRRLLTDL
jgi:uncharacterized protein